MKLVNQLNYVLAIILVIRYEFKIIKSEVLQASKQKGDLLIEKNKNQHWMNLFSQGNQLKNNPDKISNEQNKNNPYQIYRSKLYSSITTNVISLLHSREHNDFQKKNLDLSTSPDFVIKSNSDCEKIHLKKRKKRQISSIDLNLKNILKNSGSMSLSEILQQKNLSLQDLLTGKNSALQAIQSTKPTSNTSSFKIPKNPSLPLISTAKFELQDNHTTELAKYEYEVSQNPQKKGPNFNDRLDKIAEPLSKSASKDSIRKNIVFPSKFKTRNRASLPQVIKLNSLKEILTPTNAKGNETNQLMNNIREKERIKKNEDPEDSKLKENKDTIMPESKFIYSTSVEKSQIKTDSDFQKYTNTENKNNIETNAVLFLDLLSGSNIDERSELLELIKDGRSSSRLFKVLNQRNMTLDELIEHRKRGSSQLHLSQFMNDKSSSVKSQSTLKQNLDIVTAFENFPHFNFINIKSIRPDDIKTDSEGYSYFTSISSEILPRLQLRDEKRSLFHGSSMRKIHRK